MDTNITQRVNAWLNGSFDEATKNEIKKTQAENPDELTDALIATGVVHITAASGMNVTLVAGAMFLVFASFLQRKTAILVSVVSIWFYAVIAGFDPSITRATIMASIAFSAALLGRQHAGWYGLFLTGCVMLFCKSCDTC